MKYIYIYIYIYFATKCRILFPQRAKLGPFLFQIIINSLTVKSPMNLVQLFFLIPFNKEQINMCLARFSTVYVFRVLKNIFGSRCGEIKLDLFNLNYWMTVAFRLFLELKQRTRFLFQYENLISEFIIIQHWFILIYKHCFIWNDNRWCKQFVTKIFKVDYIFLFQPCAQSGEILMK